MPGKIWTAGFALWIVTSVGGCCNWCHRHCPQTQPVAYQPYAAPVCCPAPVTCSSPVNYGAAPVNYGAAPVQYQAAPAAPAGAAPAQWQRSYTYTTPSGQTCTCQ